MAAIKTAEMERDTWLQERSKGIGGSDVATVLGLNPYKTPLKLWEEDRQDQRLTGRRSSLLGNNA